MLLVTLVLGRDGFAGTTVNLIMPPWASIFRIETRRGCNHRWSVRIFDIHVVVHVTLNKHSYDDGVPTFVVVENDGDMPIFSPFALMRGIDMSICFGCRRDGDISTVFVFMFMCDIYVSIVSVFKRDRDLSDVFFMSAHPVFVQLFFCVHRCWDEMVLQLFVFVVSIRSRSSQLLVYRLLA